MPDSPNFHSLLQGAWLGGCLPRAFEFARMARRSLRETQVTVLLEIVKRNRETAFGREHGFASISDETGFRGRVPCREYDEFSGWIQRIADGEPDVLTSDQVLLFERSSGSTAASKLVPYTSGLQNAFNRALHPWMVDLYRNFSGLWGGPAYWVITPLASVNERTKGGIPVGFNSDTAYFGHWLGKLVSRLMAVPDWLRLLSDVEAFQYVTLWHLVRLRDLRLISLWNPSWFSILLDRIPAWGSRLCRDLFEGTCSPPQETRTTRNLVNTHLSEAPALPDRSRELAALLGELVPGNAQGLGEKIWPRLSLISCWTDAEAGRSLGGLREWFPTTEVQSKGLLATEGAVTIPIGKAGGNVLAATSAFFEFQEGEEGDTPMRYAWELEPGGAYRVTMTTPGGLYRYRLHDIIRVEGGWHRLPGLKFLGKESLVSDLRGEKLNARHVTDLLSRLVPGAQGAFLAPEIPDSGPPVYVLFLPSGISCPDEKTLRQAFERGLRDNFHYDWCRKIGQLGEMEIQRLPFNSSELLRRRFDRMFNEKIRPGAAKLSPLSPLKNWKCLLLHDHLNGSP